MDETQQQPLHCTTLYATGPISLFSTPTFFSTLNLCECNVSGRPMCAGVRGRLPRASSHHPEAVSCRLLPRSILGILGSSPSRCRRTEVAAAPIWPLMWVRCRLWVTRLTQLILSHLSHSPGPGTYFLTSLKMGSGTRNVRVHSPPPCSLCIVTSTTIPTDPWKPQTTPAASKAYAPGQHSPSTWFPGL